MTRKEFIKRWRAAKCPRLYWKSNNRRWRWDSDVIAKTDGMYFTGWEGLEEFLLYCEALNEQDEKQRKSDALEVANNCIGILAELLCREMGLETNMRDDNQPFIEFTTQNNQTGKKHTFMRIDVKCQIFEGKLP